MNCFNTIRNIIDLFGNKVQLKYKSKEIFHSQFTLIFSIIFLLFSIYWIIMYSVQNFNYNNFNLTTSYYDDIFYEIDLENFPIMYQYQSYNGENILEKSDLFTIDFLYMNYTKIQNENGTSYLDVSYKFLETEDCNLDKHFNQFYDLFKDTNFTGFKCIKPNQNVIISGKNYDLINGNKQLYIYINKCDNSIMNNKCLDEEYINKTLENGFFTFYYPINEIDHFAHNKPIKLKISSQSFSFSNYLFKKHFFLFSSSNYQIDDNLFFNKKKSYNFIEIYNIDTDVSFYAQKTGLFDKAIGYINFKSSCIKIKNNKTYTHLTQLIANIFGNLHIMFLLFKYFSEFITEKIFINELINTLFNQKIKNIQISSNISSLEKSNNLIIYKNFNLNKNKKIKTKMNNINSFKNNKTINMQKVEENNSYTNFNINFFKKNNYINEYKINIFYYCLPLNCIKLNQSKIKNYQIYDFYTNIENIIPILYKISHFEKGRTLTKYNNT